MKSLFFFQTEKKDNTNEAIFKADLLQPKCNFLFYWALFKANMVVTFLT